MPNPAYEKGRRYEYKTMRILENLGYKTYRMAGSHTEFDVLAILTKNGTEQPLFRALQIKSGKSPIKKDLAKLKKLNLPSSVSKELWIYKEKRKPPEIIVVENKT